MSFRKHALTLACLSLLPLPAIASEWSISHAGSVQHDYARYRLDGLNGDEHSARRTRLGLRAEHSSGLELRGEWDFFSGTVTDLFAEMPIGPGALRFGQQKQPFSLEEQGSSRDLVLIERSLAHDAFSTSRRVGLSWTQPLQAWQLQSSLHAGTAEQVSGVAGTAVRLTRELQPGLHVGAALAHDRRDDERVRIRARPESRLLPFAPLDMGNFRDISGSTKAGIEGAWIRGSWTFQSEYFGLRTRGGQAPRGHGGYVQASWLSHERSRSLREGVVRKPKFEAGDIGWELTTRLSRVEFSADPGALGDQVQLALGAVFYLGAHWQLAAEHSRFDADHALRLNTGGEHDGHFSSLRVQLSF